MGRDQSEDVQDAGRGRRNSAMQVQDRFIADMLARTTVAPAVPEGASAIIFF